MGKCVIRKGATRGRHSANNFRVPNIDQHIGERLSTAYFRAATVGKAVKGFQKWGSEILLCLANMTFKATEQDGVGEETENTSATPQTLVVENKQINPPEC
ncbi:hypothetical protein TNCV_3696921 [Trichonephila clavipes]|uniref:Uncharacterized protein n=1 Tax=Trichonephila clavipes TaxID=2585209 RepID=A0A8X6SE52_TRICX|nr:hypothetical protein TNCV_3696921 [Trichonephila clavipes]